MSEPPVHINVMQADDLFLLMKYNYLLVLLEI